MQRLHWVWFIREVEGLSEIIVGLCAILRWIVMPSELLVWLSYSSMPLIGL